MSQTAVIYARFSSSRQRDTSIADQLRVCSEYCEGKGIRVVGSYCDHAYSGRTDARPEFQRMIANAGEADLVVVYAMDRFSRDPYDAPLYKKRLRDASCKVVSATESIPDGPEAVLLERIYEGFASMESQKISQRTRRGMDGNALRCHHNGVPVFGYRHGDDGRYVVDDAEAAIVREVFARRLAGEQVNAIAADLARRGVKTTTGRPASHTFVHCMLRNRKYIGEYRWGEHVEPGGMPAIIDPDTFEAAQHVRSTKVRAREDWSDYMLSGKSICACGENLVGTSGRNRTGTKYEYYRCRTGCGIRGIRADALDAMVVAALRKLVESGHAEAIADIVAERARANGPDARATELRRRIAECERAGARIADAIADGAARGPLLQKLDDLERDAEAARDELRRLEVLSGFDREDFLTFLRTPSMMDDRQLVDALVWRVQLGADSVVILLNYDVDGSAAWAEVSRDGSRKVTFGSGEPEEKKERPGSSAETPGAPDSVWLPARDFMLTLAGRRVAVVLQRAA